MLPPSDSFGHQARKAAEVIAQAQRNHASAARPPPPPYSSVSGDPSRHMNKPPHLSRDLDYYYDEDDDLDSNDGADGQFDTGTVTIKIDASISIVGDRNTIAIPPVSRPVSDRNNLNDQEASSSQPPNKATEPPQSEDGTGQSQQTSTDPARQARMHLQRFQQQRHSQYAELANTIVSALLADKSNGGKAPRRVEVDLDGGIRIQGTGNVVCAGVLPRAPARADISSPNSRVEKCTVADKTTLPSQTIVGRKRCNSVRVPCPPHFCFDNGSGLTSPFHVHRNRYPHHLQRY